MTDAALLIHLTAIAVAVAAVGLLPRISRDTVPFGVRVPPERVGAPEVAAATRAFVLSVLATGALAAVASLLLWPVLPAGAATGTAGALLAAGLAACYARAHRAVRRAKAQGDWYAGLRQGVAADTSLRTAPLPFPWLGALPSLLVTAATAAVGAVLYPGLPDRLVTAVVYRGEDVEYTTAATTPVIAFAPVFFQAVMVAVLLLLLRLTLRARPDGDASRPRENADRHRRFLRIWARSVLVAALLSAVALGGLALLFWTGTMAGAGPAAAALVAVPTLLSGLVPLGVAVRIGQGGWRLRADARDGAGTGLVQQDDDRFWHLGGLVYVNRRAPGLLVPKRAGGFGWTVNLGHPAAWAVLGAVALAVAVPLTLGLLGVVDLGGSDFYGWKFEPGAE
ncbi:DUF5808 domain-containing protein [Nocardiopsis sp. RSe5-2]|uniref:DUF5808 domain-containing protein n=1 Tax=Nocardiopsis endophytica TaxID=3018445 RepID=A0ABT4U297_9ACTN|nr:DUF5808 domain-containing protein [Nocardiopsis endophytica]MDA2811050.1 DUF5808 domain-containing protein [Nocardiopsis endophytica]